MAVAENQNQHISSNYSNLESMNGRALWDHVSLQHLTIVLSSIPPKWLLFPGIWCQLGEHRLVFRINTLSSKTSLSWPVSSTGMRFHFNAIARCAEKSRGNPESWVFVPVLH